MSVKNLKNLPVSKITIDPAIQQRADGVDPDYVQELADVLRGGTPHLNEPVVVYAPDKIEGPFLLAGGHHSLEAYALAGRTTIPAEIRLGGHLDALKYALGDNVGHGRRRSQADARKAVTTAINHPDLQGLTDRQIDELCKVGAGYTSRLRRELTGAAPDAKKSQAAKSSNKAQGKGSSEPETPLRPAGPAASKAAEPGRPEAEDDGLPDAKAPLVHPRDQLGRVIPKRIQAIFAEGRTIAEAAAKVRSASALAQKADGSKLIGGLHRRHPGIAPALRVAAAGLARLAPFAVCPACEGGPDKACPTCGGCGWIDFTQYEQLPEPMKVAANSHKPGDAWESDDPLPPAGPPSAFVPPGPGLDAVGSPIPKRLRDVFADRWLPELSAQLSQAAETIKAASAWNPWLDVGYAMTLQTAADSVMGARPFAVCGCQGKGCDQCLTAGFLPAWQAPQILGE